MAKVEIRKESTGDTAEEPATSQSMAKMWRQLFLMSIGAAALAQDEAEKLVKKLVEHGEMAEKEAKQAMEDMTSRRKSVMNKRQAKMDEHMEQMLHRLNVPTKADVKALEQRIAELSAKLERAEATKASTTTEATQPPEDRE